ncbi:MAG TPA: hypothetical protein VFV68_17385 [Agriterribacter sp.]|nr:hypothetical protein [Agriterribacter sp.]
MCGKSTFTFEWENRTYRAYYSRSMEANGQIKYTVTFPEPNPFPQFGEEPHELFCESYGKFCCVGSNDTNWIYFRVNLMQWLKKHLERQDRMSLSLPSNDNEHLPLEY